MPHFNVFNIIEGVEIVTESHINGCEFNKKSKQIELTLTGGKKVIIMLYRTL